MVPRDTLSVEAAQGEETVMPAKEQHPPGTASWVDIGTDVDAAKRFYGSLFSWQEMEAGPPEETGGYGFFTKAGAMVAGYGPQQNPGPPAWAVYFAVTDADATTKKVEGAGGTVVVAPMDVMTAGRMAVYQDPGGAFFSVWQPGDHKGAQVVGESGALSWVELQTRDVEAAKRFYPAVFGWTVLSHEGPMTYNEFQMGSDSIGGMMEMGPQMPAEVPPHWLAYFGVDDVDKSAARAGESGGQVVAGPMDYPGGRFAVVVDPQGAAFGLLNMG
ncbi:MAG TPA: VOC family protein [Acidimicrobiales bacterium]|nr:VOC family protein [Acidimicrobiales bacterium]